MASDWFYVESWTKEEYSKTTELLGSSDPVSVEPVTPLSPSPHEVVWPAPTSAGGWTVTPPSVHREKRDTSGVRFYHPESTTTTVVSDWGLKVRPANLVPP